MEKIRMENPLVKKFAELFHQCRGMRKLFKLEMNVLANAIPKQIMKPVSSTNIHHLLTR